MSRHAVLLLLAPVALAACAGDPARLARGRAVVEAEALAAQRRPLEAEAAARALLARGDLDPDHRCAVRLALGRALAGQGRAEDALEALSALGAECPERSADSARGLLEVAALADRAGHPGARDRVLERVVTAFPDDPAARRAVEALRDSDVRAGGADRAVARLASLYRAVPAREVSPALLFEAAALRQAQGTPAARAEALALYGQVADRHPRSGLANDAQMAAARLALDLGRPGDSVRRLESLLSQRHWSYLLGSYELGLYADAAFLLGDAVLAAGDPAEAAARWQVFARTWPKDRRVPAALLKASRALAAAGDGPASVRLLHRLLREHPGTPEGRAAAATVGPR